MDPNTCLRKILEGLAALASKGKNGDRDMTVYRLRSLADWLERGGFPPEPSAPNGCSECGSRYYYEGW